MKSKLSFLLALGLLLCAAGSAEAKTDRELTYRPTQIWSSAVRFLRVEQHFKIVEKDKEASYLLFEYKDTGRTYLASMEIVDVVRAGKKYVRVRLSISEMPSYVERVLADKFLRKLKDEYGPMPAPTLLAPPVVPVSQASSAGTKGGKNVDHGADEDDLEITEEDLDNSVEGED